MTDMTNEEILELIKQAKKTKKSLVHITNQKTLSIDDKFKLSLCKHFVRYMNENKMKTSELASLLGTTQSRISEIVHYKIKKFSLEKLFAHLEKLSEKSPRIREYLNLIEQAAQVPAMKVKETRLITKELKQYTEEYYDYA